MSLASVKLLPLPLQIISSALLVILAFVTQVPVTPDWNVALEPVESDK